VILLDPFYTDGDTEKGDGLQDPLDRHVDSVLRKPARFKRTMQGVWSFLRTRKVNLLFFTIQGLMLHLALGVRCCGTH
jgi:hypothetical protein